MMYYLNLFRRRNQRSRDEQQQIYDDKDRETFGDDFVADHQKHENPLMMPGMLCPIFVGSALFHQKILKFHFNMFTFHVKIFLILYHQSTLNFHN